MKAITKKSIERYLKYPIDVEVKKELTSTNTVLKECADKGSLNSKLLVALSQTQGRGRLKRKFFSAKDCGVYFSFLVPKLDQAKGELLTIITALSVYRVVSLLSTKDIGIKWVNDIYADGKKCAGILVEGARNIETGSLNYAIVGVGVNIKEPKYGYQKEIKNIATTAINAGDYKAGIESAIVAGIYNQFMDIYTSASSDEIIKEYTSHLFILGKRITASYGDKAIEATAIDIDERGGLIVELDDGSRTTLTMGEITLKILFDKRNG